MVQIKRGWYNQKSYKLNSTHGFNRGDEKSLTRNKNMPHNNDLNLWQIIKIIIIIKNVEKKPCGIVYTYKTTDDVV